jgi:hypothetical protein
MTGFNPILQRRFPKSPEFHTAQLQRLSKCRSINVLVTRQSKSHVLLLWLTSVSRRNTIYKLKHSNLNTLFQLLNLHNLVASLSNKDFYQYCAWIHVIITTSTQPYINNTEPSKSVSFNKTDRTLQFGRSVLRAYSAVTALYSSAVAGLVALSRLFQFRIKFRNRESIFLGSLDGKSAHRKDSLPTQKLGTHKEATSWIRTQSPSVV